MLDYPQLPRSIVIKPLRIPPSDSDLKPLSNTDTYMMASGLPEVSSPTTKRARDNSVSSVSSVSSTGASTLWLSLTNSTMDLPTADQCFVHLRLFAAFNNLHTNCRYWWLIWVL